MKTHLGRGLLSDPPPRLPVSESRKANPRAVSNVGLGVTTPGLCPVTEQQMRKHTIIDGGTCLLEGWWGGLSIEGFHGASPEGDGI